MTKSTVPAESPVPTPTMAMVPITITTTATEDNKAPGLLERLGVTKHALIEIKMDCHRKQMKERMQTLLDLNSKKVKNEVALS
jgi:hypothetical protein